VGYRPSTLNPGNPIAVGVAARLTQGCTETLAPTSNARAFLSMIRGLLLVSPMTTEIHENGLALAERHNLSIYDAMIVASALHAGCGVLWSEDMQDGMTIGKRLRVVNPFVRIKYK